MASYWVHHHDITYTTLTLTSMKLCFPMCFPRGYVRWLQGQGRRGVIMLTRSYGCVPSSHTATTTSIVLMAHCLLTVLLMVLLAGGSRSINMLRPFLMGMGTMILPETASIGGAFKATPSPGHHACLLALLPLQAMALTALLFCGTPV